MIKMFNVSLKYCTYQFFRLTTADEVMHDSLACDHIGDYVLIHCPCNVKSI